MNESKKQELLALISATVEKFLSESDDVAKPKIEESPMEMLTINEAAQEVKGLSAHTVRQLIAQGKIPSIRTGAGQNGKILVPKAALLKYLSGELG